MKKRIFKNKIRLLKYFDQKDLGSIPRVLVSSVIVIFFFYSAPILINFSNKENSIFQNNSKKVLAYTLKNQDSIDKDNQILNEKD